MQGVADIQLVYNNTFYDGIVSEGFTWECSFCLNIMYANLRVQNKTLTKINLNYLLITYDDMC